MKSMFFIIIITYKKSPHERALNLINFANYEKITNAIDFLKAFLSFPSFFLTVGGNTFK